MGPSFVMRRNSLILLGFLVALLVPAVPAGAKTAVPHAPATVVVRAGVHRDFERLVFDWPRAASYSLKQSGTQVTIEFAAAGQADLRPADKVHLKIVRDLSFHAAANGHLVVTFQTGAHGRASSFRDGRSVVVDIRAAKTKEPPSREAKAPALPPQKPATPEAAPKIVEASATPPKAIPNPPAGNQPATPAPASTAASTAETANQPAAAPAAPSATPPPLEAPPAAAPAPAKPASMPVIGEGSQLVASLDPHVVARAVVWQRAGYGYIVFDRKFTLTPDALAAGQPPALVDLEPLELANASGFRFLTPPSVDVRATRVGTVWQIYMSKQHLDVPVSTALVAQPDFALGARFLLPLPDAPTPIRMTDPVVGDDLILVPLRLTEAFTVARRMADFLVLPAAQGLVIKPLNDKLWVRAVSDGIEISAPNGLHISSAADTGASQESAQKQRAAAAGKSLFDFAGWKGRPGETFTEIRQRLQQTVVDVPESERNRARLDLARFYFANGNGAEARALLHYLAILVPDLLTHADFMALYGASEILAWRPADGLADFDNPQLAGQPEIELWSAVAHADLRDWKRAEGEFSDTQNLLGGYPEPFYSRFSILSVESALAVGKWREAKDWLDRLENGNHRSVIDPEIEYLHGVIDSKDNRLDSAEELWQEVTHSNDRLYAVRAELALIDLAVAEGRMTPKKAADRLESLRFAWRGDDLEFDILRRLGDFYIKAHDIKQGLNTLDQAVRLYPKSPQVPAVQAEMSKVFTGVFLDNLAPDLSAVDAFTLYHKFHGLMPEGADGAAIIRNLAERLVSI
ncbi:MAG TPA: hypothetical protein VMV79_00975, partial [Alphaproteobacteria bacterium]|nr:hypothetical protein [Alphaproteobacteria bacterium]